MLDQNTGVELFKRRERVLKFLEGFPAAYVNSQKRTGVPALAASGARGLLESLEDYRNAQKYGAEIAEVANWVYEAYKKHLNYVPPPDLPETEDKALKELVAQKIAQLKQKLILPTQERKTTVLSTDSASAVYNRGLSFIEAAELIVKHAELDAKKQNEIQTYLTAVKGVWNNKKANGPLKQVDLGLLERHLIDTIRTHIYRNKKSWSDVKDELDNAENHVNWKMRSPLSLTDTIDGVELTRVEAPIAHFTTAQEAEWLKILNDSTPQPQWFTALAPWEQNYFKQRIESWQKTTPPRENLGEFLGSVPTTIRRYPGSPNAYHTEATIQGPYGEFTFYKIRSGVVAPVKMKAKSEAQKEQKVRITQQNMEQLLVEAVQAKLAGLPKVPKPGQEILELPILLQTLYSPPMQPPGSYNNEAIEIALERMRNKLKDKTECDQFFKENGINTAYTLHIDLLFSNRPVNKVRGLSEFSSKNASIGKENTHTIEQLSKYMKKQAPNMPAQDRVLAKKALEEFGKIDKTISVLNALKLLGQKSSNPLAEKAAYEQIVASKLGVRIGSCVSGKDREEMITNIALAQIQFYSKYGHYPPSYDAHNPDDPERHDFENMVAHWYLKGHGQKLAAENSKGCDGLKNVVDVFGTRICDKIRALAPQYGIQPEFDPVKDVQRTAGLNKLSHSKLGKVKNTELTSFISVIKNVIKVSLKRPKFEKEVGRHPLAFAFKNQKQTEKAKRLEKGPSAVSTSTPESPKSRPPLTK